VARIGVPQLHFHDLRHTGNTWAAASGVSTRDLMTRMGHDSMNAALIYQHASKEADQAIAAALDARLVELRVTMRTRTATRTTPARMRRGSGCRRANGPQDPLRSAGRRRPGRGTCP
jgi:hypothetical protein